MLAPPIIISFYLKKKTIMAKFKILIHFSSSLYVSQSSREKSMPQNAVENHDWVSYNLSSSRLSGDLEANSCLLQIGFYRSSGSDILEGALSTRMPEAM